MSGFTPEEQRYVNEIVALVNKAAREFGHTGAVNIMFAVTYTVCSACGAAATRPAARKLLERLDDQLADFPNRKH